MEEQNNKIIDRILDEQNQDNWEKLLADNDQILITSARVASIRYRVYVIILLIAIVIFANNFLFKMWDRYQNVKSDLWNTNLQVADFTNKKMQFDANKELIKKIDNQENAIISCLNSKLWCQSIDEAIKNNFSFARSYILLNNLTDAKMSVNEKILLANINWYLLKNFDTKARNGIINKISIWDPIKFVDNLYYAPIKLNITFDNKDWLFSFIENVERKILDNSQYRVLYKIDKISYDIANYNTIQNVDVDLLAYYYTN